MEEFLPRPATCITFCLELILDENRIQEASRLKISSLDEPAKDCEKLNLGDIISSDFEDPAEIISQNELKEKLSELISRLNDQQKKVLSMRFGLEGEDPLSLRDIGKNLALVESGSGRFKTVQSAI